MSPTSASTPQMNSISGAMLTLKVLHIGFMAGVGLFAIVVFVMQATASATPPGAPPAAPASGGMDMQSLFAIMLGAIGATVLPVSAFILPAMRKRAGIDAADAAPDADPDAPKIAAVNTYTTALILRAAMVEGWGLFGAVAALLTENPLFLTAPLLAVAIIGAYFPTRAKFERFYTEAIERASKDTFQ